MYNEIRANYTRTRQDELSVAIISARRRNDHYCSTQRRATPKFHPREYRINLRAIYRVDQLELPLEHFRDHGSKRRIFPIKILRYERGHNILFTGEVAYELFFTYFHDFEGIQGGRAGLTNNENIHVIRGAS